MLPYIHSGGPCHHWSKVRTPGGRPPLTLAAGRAIRSTSSSCRPSGVVLTDTNTVFANSYVTARKI
jgi:hypothetical protein